MKDISKSKFSKIGTNPKKYFENYLSYINTYEKGSIFKINSLNIFYEGISIFKAESETTFRQNIDAWVWMGFVIRKNKDQIIKIVDTSQSDGLLEHIKWSLLIDTKDKLINQHRNTILLKLITMDLQSSVNSNYTYEEIKKETGEFEKILFKDKKYIAILKNIMEVNNGK